MSLRQYANEKDCFQLPNDLKQEFQTTVISKSWVMSVMGRRPPGKGQAKVFNGENGSFWPLVMIGPLGACGCFVKGKRARAQRLSRATVTDFLCFRSPSDPLLEQTIILFILARFCRHMSPKGLREL